MAEDKNNGAAGGEKDKPYVPEFDVVEGKEPVAKDKDKSYASDDERLSADQRADDDDAPDTEEVAPDTGDETAEQLEAKRAKRRAERRAQKARQNAARNRDKTELGYLRSRNEQLERRVSAVETTTAKRLTQNELATVEGRLQQLQAALVEADGVYAEAISAQDGEGAAKVQRAQRELQDGINKLTSYRDRVRNAATAEADDEGDEDSGEEAQQRIPVPPGVVNNARVFTARHKWCNPNGGDQDSDIVKVLDAAVLAEGFDPATKDYWEELEDRMRTALPHRMRDSGRTPPGDDDEDDDDDGPPARGKNGGGKVNGHGGPRMAASGQNRGGGKKFFLTAERKQALIDAGAWEDPVLRDRYLKSFQKWDQEQAAQKRGN